MLPTTAKRYQRPHWVANCLLSAALKFEGSSRGCNLGLTLWDKTRASTAVLQSSKEIAYLLMQKRT